MLSYPNWITWKLVQRPGKPKPDKIPLDGNNPFRDGDVTDPLKRRPWRDVRTIIDLGFDHVRGAGFVLSADAPFYCIDLDGVYDPTTGVWDQVAVDIIGMFPTGVYIEWSQSGKGVHIFGVGKRLDGFHFKSPCKRIEIYDDLRFIAMTFNTIRGSWDDMTDTSLIMQTVMLMHLGARQAHVGMAGVDWEAGPREPWVREHSDDEILLLCHSHSSAAVGFGDAASFTQLWTLDPALGSFGKYAKEDGSLDGSTVDLAIMNTLAHFTKCDAGRMDRLFRQSPACRDKYMERPDYRARTVGMACGRDKVYQEPKPVVTAPGAINSDIAAHVARFTNEILDVQEQMDFFAGCVYVASRNEIFMPNGSFAKQESFRSGLYAGHLFIIDQFGKTTSNAWEAFTQNRAVRFPKVTSVCFRPDLPSGVVGDSVNVYVPVETKRTHGDVSRFIDHVKKMFPHERDREIITSFMAAVVQHPDVKFQWCPVIQGTEGNGKSMLIRAITHAIGERYTHSVNSNTLKEGGAKFNKWIEGKLFIDFEEIYTGDRRDMMEILKPIVTNPRLEIQGKGLDQYTGDNRANMIMATNHKDAIVKTRKDRRYAILFTAQQDYDDCIRDGMTDDYFYSLYNWLNGGGYAAVAGWLAAYPIRDEFNPATRCQRAPETSCVTEAITQSLGVVEQYVEEWIETGRTGFNGGWISSAKLEDALKEVGLASRMAPNKRRAMLANLGYVAHPYLAEGKCPVELFSEGGKRPRLYVKTSNAILYNLADKNTIVDMYCKAQNYG